VSIRSALQTRLIAQDLIFLEQTTSTNVVAKKMGRKGCVEGLLVVAEQQTAGRGRAGRRWSSRRGADILMSIVLRPKISPEQSAKLTGIACLAVAKAIEECLDLEPKVKWPNDVRIEGRKVCGILTEGDVRDHELAFAVVGIGINCNREPGSFRRDLAETATSLNLATGAPVDRTALLAMALGFFEEEYLLFQSVGFSTLVPELRKRLCHADQKITVRTGNVTLEGRCLGLDDEGRLLVQTVNGKVHSLCGGEILHLR